MASVDLKEMLAAAVAAAEDRKAEDIRILALDPTESGLTDYFLICTGTNDRQTVAITDAIELKLKHEYGQYPNSVEGRKQGEWILMDYVDFIVHVFLPEKRAFYGLERLRKSATTLSVADLNAEIKAAIKAKRPASPAKKTAVPADAPTSAKTATKTAVKTATKTAATPAAKTTAKLAAKIANIPDVPKKTARKSASAVSAPAKKTAKRAAGTNARKKSAAGESKKSAAN